MEIELRWMTESDVGSVVAASHLFDDAARPEWAERFLAQPNHHLCLASDGGVPAGFVSGVEITHPDKGTEMLLYELGVDEAFQRRGIGRSLIVALRELARDRGCTGMWVPVDDGDDVALGTYRSLSPDEEERAVIAWWDLSTS